MVANAKLSKFEAALSGIKDWKTATTIYISEPGGKVLFENQSNKALIPASVTKLITASAVLKHFPSGTKFKTQIFSAGTRAGEVLKGDLYLKGGGDPGFVSETMWYLVNVFVRSKVQRIEGRIVVDDSLFDSMRFDLSRQKERVDRAYDAPTGAMSFNWNSINVFVRPGYKEGESARVFLDPENEYAEIKNKVQTVGATKKTEIFVDREETKKGDLLIVRGQIALGSKEVTVFKNITKPDIWSGSQLKSFLAQRGIVVTGEVSVGVTPKEAELYAEAESKPIEQMVADMNKFSNNYVAEMLVKNLGVLRGTPATLKSGMDLVTEHLRELKLSDSEARIFNPSGLTRDNRLSAKALWTVMVDSGSKLLTSPEYLSSLAIGGVDGTLKKRFKDSDTQGWVRGKTGYLDGVVSLAGFAGRQDGTVVPFVLIYNGKTDESKVRAVFDDVVRAAL